MVAPPRRARARASRAPLPTAVVVLALVGACTLTLPLVGLGSRVSWGELPRLLAADSARSALLLSLRTCLVSTTVCVVLGVPLALVLARRWPGVRLARILAVLPMTMPPVVAGTALLSTLGRRGLLGARLEAWGLGVSFSTTAVVIAQVFVSLPYLVVTLEAALRSRDPQAETVARTLGAGPWRLLASITLPLVAPALARGTALALGRSLGEFGATIAFAGSREGVTRTMPLAIYLERENDTPTALALAVVLVAASFVVVGTTTLRWDRLLAAARGAVAAHGSGAAHARQLPHAEAPHAKAPHARQLPHAEAPHAEAPHAEAPHAEAPDAPGRTGPASTDTPTGSGPATTPSGDTTSGTTRNLSPSTTHDSAGNPAPSTTRGEDLEVVFSRPERDVVVDLLARAGRVTALLGPNGSGKSTVCAVAAGLLEATGGRVRLGDRVLDGPDGLVAAGRRGVALLGQAPTLFTHMSVVDNVAFGPRCQGMSRAGARSRARAELDAVGAAHLAARPGGGLSGGQAARVALARALATRPRVLVLDEPTAALDVPARQEVRRLVARRAQEEGLTVLLVTHDVLDVAALAHDVVVLERGRVAERGAAAQVLSRPGTDFTAQLTGTVVLTGTLAGTRQAPALELDAAPTTAPTAPPGDVVGPGPGAGQAAGPGPGSGASRAARPSGTGAGQTAEPFGAGASRATGPPPGPGRRPRAVPRAVVHGRPEEDRDGFRPGRPGAALVPPDAVALYRSAPHGSPRNVLGGVVTGLERAGALVGVELEVAAGQRLRATVTAGAVADLGIEPGQELWAVVKAVEVRVVARPAPAALGTAPGGRERPGEQARRTGSTTMAQAGTCQATVPDARPDASPDARCDTSQDTGQDTGQDTQDMGQDTKEDTA